MNISEATVIDVRTPSEYSTGNVPGSVNIPLDDIPHRMDEIKSFNGPLILCCASGGRSNAACQYLSKQGLSELYDGGPWSNVLSQMNN